MNEHLKPDEIAMRERAEKATKGNWCVSDYEVITAQGDFIAHFKQRAGNHTQQDRHNALFCQSAYAILPTILARLANERAKLAIAMKFLRYAAEGEHVDEVDEEARHVIAAINELEKS